MIFAQLAPSYVGTDGRYYRVAFLAGLLQLLGLLLGAIFFATGSSRHWVDAALLLFTVIGVGTLLMAFVGLASIH